MAGCLRSSDSTLLCSLCAFVKFALPYVWYEAAVPGRSTKVPYGVMGDSMLMAGRAVLTDGDRMLQVVVGDRWMALLVHALLTEDVVKMETALEVSRERGVSIPATRLNKLAFELRAFVENSVWDRMRSSDDEEDTVVHLSMAKATHTALLEEDVCWMQL